MAQPIKAREQWLRRRIQTMSWVLVLGLVLAGITAMPLQSELDALARFLRVADSTPEQATSSFTKWVLLVREAVHTTNARYPFLAYGTDWLAFAHFTLAIIFFGGVRHPLRNSWLFHIGMIVSVMIVPWALLVGEARGVPIGWRLLDCAFGVTGFIPCWLCSRWARELEQIKISEARAGLREAEEINAEAQRRP